MRGSPSQPARSRPLNRLTKPGRPGAGSVPGTWRAGRSGRGRGRRLRDRRWRTGWRPDRTRSTRGSQNNSVRWPKEVLKTRPLPVGLHPGQGEIVVLPVDPLHAHVGARRIEREQHAQPATVVGRTVFVDLVGEPEVLSAKGRHQRMSRLFDRHADLLVPGMPGELRPEQLLELRPVRVGRDGKMDATPRRRRWRRSPAGSAQHLLDGGFVGAVLPEGGLGQVGIRRGDPRAGTVVHDDGVEPAEVLRAETGPGRRSRPVRTRRSSCRWPRARRCRRGCSSPCAGPCPSGAPACSR